MRRIKPGSFLLWGDSTNHCTTLLKQIIPGEKKHQQQGIFTVEWVKLLFGESREAKELLAPALKVLEGENHHQHQRAEKLFIGLKCWNYSMAQTGSNSGSSDIMSEKMHTRQKRATSQCPQHCPHARRLAVQSWVYWLADFVISVICCM